MRVAALTCRSFYSLLRGAVSVLRWVQKAAEHGYGAVALADVNSMSGVVDLCRAAAKAGVRPVIGVEILTESQQAILLAENDRGYRNLCRIATARNLMADFDLIEQLRIDGRGVICICSQAKLPAELREVLPRDYLFAGCGDAKEVECAIARGVEPIAWTGVNWLDSEDREIARLLARIRQLSVTGSGPEDHYGSGTLVPVAEVERKFRDCPRALTNADRLVERCDLRLLRGRPILPRIELGRGTTGDRELARLCHLGLAKRYSPVSHAAIQRLEYELTTVRKNGFSDYFLVVHEIVNFAKRSGIPVEVRGSAAGALIAYVLGFTRVCPLENRLYFERFMNPGRTDCPDIDIDLCWRRRDEVIRFCYERWGFARVAMVCNINRYRLRSAIRDVGRALGLEPVQINQLAREGKIKRTSPVYRLAEKLVGIPRHLGVHCGGIVVTPCPVCEIAPLERANKGVIITQYDKDAAEAVGLVKIDLLGNRSLSTVSEAIQLLRSEGNDIEPVAADSSPERAAQAGIPNLSRTSQAPGSGPLATANTKDSVVPGGGSDALPGGSAPRLPAFSALRQQHAGCAEHTFVKKTSGHSLVSPPKEKTGWQRQAEPAQLADGAEPSNALFHIRRPLPHTQKPSASRRLPLPPVGKTVCGTHPAILTERPSPGVQRDNLRGRLLPVSCYWPKATNAKGSGAEPLRSTSFDPNDGKTARMLSEGDSLGVFQSESPGMRQLLRGLQVKSKKDLAIALSLIRPGPASGGMKSEFIERHVHGKPFQYLHPKIEKLLGDTCGVMLYQEDVMRIAVEVAGYTVADADRFRSEVSKKVSAARVQAQYVDFVRMRAERAGIDRRTAEAIWDEVLRFAAYSYCKAHATVYANIAWQTAWLKAHYPRQFYCSLLNNHQGMYPLRVYVWDAKRHGVPVLPPHVNHSGIEWSLQDGDPPGDQSQVGTHGVIRAGLNIVKGLTGGTIRAIIEQRQVCHFRDLEDLRRRVRFRRPELQNLIHVGACDGLGATRPTMLNSLRFSLPQVNQPLLFDIRAAPSDLLRTSRVFASSAQDVPVRAGLKPAPTGFHASSFTLSAKRLTTSLQTLPDYDEVAKLEAELDVTGIPFCIHPAVLLPDRYVPAERLPEFSGRRVTVAGFVATARRARTNDNRVMGFVTLEDATGLIELSFFPDRLALYKTICSYGGPVWASGRVTEHLSSLSLDCAACARLG